MPGVPEHVAEESIELLVPNQRDDDDNVVLDEGLILQSRSSSKLREYRKVAFILFIPVCITATTIAVHSVTNDNVFLGYPLENIDELPGGSVRLLALGDWGSCGVNYEPRTQPDADDIENCAWQRSVSLGMVAKSQTFQAQAVLGIGDSFYPHGLTSDTMFANVFSKMYDRHAHPSLDIPWYNIFGNHDYHEKHFEKYADAGIRNRDPRWNNFFEGSTPFQSKDKTLSVEVVFLDTTPFDEHYLRQYTNPGGTDNASICKFEPQRLRDASPNDPASWRKELQEQLRSFEARLISARRREVQWLIVVGHNPIRSLGDHGDQPALLALVDPLLWRYNVDAYINGHDHHAEHTVMDRCCVFRRPPDSLTGESVVLNEVLVDVDDDKWVELLNIGKETVDITGWRLVKQSKSENCKVDSVVKSLAPGEFLVVDCAMEEGSDGLSLLDAKGKLKSEFVWGFSQMANGYSIGRFPDGSANELVAMEATRSTPNNPGTDRSPHLPENAPTSMNRTGVLPPVDQRFVDREPGSPGQRMHYLVVGNGGKLGGHPNPAPVHREDSHPNASSQFFRREAGFVALEADSRTLSMQFLDSAGDQVYEVTIAKGH